MDKNSEIYKGYEYLKNQKVVRITKPLQLFDSKYKFECTIPIPYPNQENLPPEVLLHVIIPDTFPFAKIYFCPLSTEVRDFPHQPNGYLCLKDDRLAPKDHTKLFCYVQWAKEWLHDAATGSLQKDGEIFELPNFKIQQHFLTVFNETTASYTKWKKYFKQYGKVACALVNSNIYAINFLEKSGKNIFDTEYIKKFSTEKKFFLAWVLLPDICYKRYRVPQNYQEFVELFTRHNMAFKDIWEYVKSFLSQEIEIESQYPPPFNGSLNVTVDQIAPILLVGFPIPKYIGKELQEIHWQPLFSQIEWGPSKNISRERMYSRGSYTKSVQKLKFSVIGCGALGSQVTELLARGGVEHLSLFDEDRITTENLCRHTLDGRDLLLQNKAIALANKMSITNTFSEIIGHPFFIPLPHHINNNKDLKLASKSLEESDIFIDCSTNESASLWLSDYAKSCKKRLVVMFFNLHAEILTLYISGKDNSANSIFEDMLKYIKSNEISKLPKNYYNQDNAGEILEGAGCWQATFPALNAHIQMLSSTAVTIFTEHIEQKETGLAILVKRNTIGNQPILEILWKKEYP